MRIVVIDEQEERAVVRAAKPAQHFAIDLARVQAVEFVTLNELFIKRLHNLPAE